MVLSGVAAASATISQQQHQRQPVRRKATDCRSRPLRVVRRRAINALARFSGGTDMFYHLRRIRAVRRQLGRNVTARLVTALVQSCLDYCKRMAGLPASTLAPFHGSSESCTQRHAPFWISSRVTV